MIKAEVLQKGSILDVEYPIMKRWFGSETYALFSTAHHAIIVAVSEMHSEVDFVGQQVSDPTDRNWHTVNNFRIVLSDCE